MPTWTGMVVSSVGTQSVDKVVEHFILVAEDVVVNVEHLWRLSRQDERLHETTHRTHVVGQLTSHLTQQHTHTDTCVIVHNRISPLLHQLQWLKTPEWI